MSFEMHASAGINSAAHSPEYDHWSSPDDPVYEFTTGLTVTAEIINPSERAGHEFRLEMRGHDAPSESTSRKLRDIQAVDEYNAPKYRTYRGRQIPVYVTPPSLGLIDKVRGEDAWQCYIFTTKSFALEALAVLREPDTVYLMLHERLEDRKRWLQHLSVQTNDPLAE